MINPEKINKELKSIVKSSMFLEKKEVKDFIDTYKQIKKLIRSKKDNNAIETNINNFRNNNRKYN